MAASGGRRGIGTLRAIYIKGRGFLLGPDSALKWTVLKVVHLGNMLKTTEL